MQAFKDPGTTYKVHQQCKLVFGQDFVECPFSNNPLCRRLWCTNKNENNTGCRTKHMPWADGTPCAPNKECQQGTCLPIPSSKPTVINGGWGPWSSYGRCSRTCESGVKTKYRECNNPYPANGGKYCLGSRERYKSCNIKVPCPPDAKDFRQVQCESEQMKRKFSYLLTNFTWTAKFTGAHKRDNCKLYCGNLNSTSYLEFSKKVIDGTTCGQYTDDVCVNGQCWAVGCDRRLGSTKKRDECGKCGGDGSTCRLITGAFNNAIYGYNFITRIPAEATDIEIRQFGQKRHVKDDDNYLALKDANGTWILNGEYTVRTEPWKIKMKQALLEYSGSEQLVERINTTMMIKEDINLYVLSVGKLYPPNITFSYMISVSVNMTKYSWKSQGWTKCNALCNGERRSQPVCVNLETSKRVNSRECKEEKPPDPTIERCNRECKLRWHVVRQEDCSVRCGRGERQQVVQCIKDFANKTMETVNDLECIKVHGSKQEYIPCQGQCLPTYWTYTEWSKCSVSCGDGVQQRLAKCVDKTNKELPDSECKDKVTTRTCRYKECPEWIISKWHECSVTCGRGYVQRKVWCMRADQRVDDAECNKTKPEDKRDCEMRKCPEWVPGGWGPCSVTCGLGVSMRAMKCVDNSNGRINREDEVCDPSTRPSDKKSCFMGECPTTTTTTQKTLVKAAYWKYGYWTECSTTCGSGIKHRVVSCIDYNGLTVKETECSHLPRPNNEESCMLKPCGNWRRGDWTDCSVTCGDGIQTRFVACTFKEQRHDERFCDITIKPETEIRCNRGTCLGHDDLSIAVITSNKVVGTSHWRVGSWSSCSNTCGTGWERRVVMCRDETGPSNECDKKLKPDEFHACDSGPCPSWHYDPTWSNCSASKCHETGLQNRLVVCRLPNGDVLANSNCDHRNKPQESQVCKGLCEKPEIEGTWKEGQWSACSVTCGHGTRLRNVTCVDGNGNDIPYDLCTKKKPRNIKRCLRGHCPRWHTGHWSKCSTSCGPGEKMREIKCKDKRHRFVDPGLCDHEPRPKTTMACVRKECATYRWEVGPWSECSKTCGFGRKHRSVTCIEHGGSRVSVHLCDSDTKPKIKRRCSEFPCPYIWNTGPWSECSATCGEGKQTRTVVCQAVTKEGWILPGEVHYGCRPSEKPVPTRYCIYGDCGSKNHWFAGQWGECSSPCGHGIQTRQATCVNKHKVQTKRNSCAPLYRPEISRPCYNGHCYATSCKEFKTLTTIRKDADYQLKVGNQLVKIFCKDMRKKEPKEYISLPQGPSENFAEMFDKQLKDPTSCPNEGKRPEENCSE
ncbi:unnamed protein product [Lymnaea stagnalis]|uniref:GON domain-containing protein n=1 Tax=Lymnaea stagnalis TaxID=6523 RepID=A0AAV2INN4_LYMST